MGNAGNRVFDTKIIIHIVLIVIFSLGKYITLIS